MSTHTPTGFCWADIMEPLEAQRRVRFVASFAEYAAKDIYGDRNLAVEAIASLLRRQPEAVDATVLRRAAEQVRSARGRR
jgi:hypothetical protein